MKIKPQEATADAFAKWNDPGSPRDINKLYTKYFVKNSDFWQKIVFEEISQWSFESFQKKHQMFDFQL